MMRRAYALAKGLPSGQVRCILPAHQRDHGTAMKDWMFFPVALLIAAALALSGMLPILNRPKATQVIGAAEAGAFVLSSEDLAKATPGPGAEMNTWPAPGASEPSVRYAVYKPGTYGAPDDGAVITINLAPQVVAALRGKPLAVRIRGRKIPVNGATGIAVALGWGDRTPQFAAVRSLAPPSPEDVRRAVKAGQQTPDFAPTAISDQIGDSMALLDGFPADFEGPARLVLKPAIQPVEEFPYGVEISKITLEPAVAPALRGR
jgi:hypothetical protein